MTKKTKTKQAKYSMLDFAKSTLDAVKRPLTPSEIWNEGERLGFHEKVRTVEWDNSMKGERIRSIASNLGRLAKGKNSHGFSQTDGRPAKFYTEISEGDDSGSVQPSLSQRGGISFAHERDVHPVLAYVANQILLGGGKEVWTKTIKHENSEKPGYSEWLHPDMVGIHMPSWHNKALAELGKAIATDSSMLAFYSFEIKQTINTSNYRESFFQAVSNSSWANEGYLVALNIRENAPDLMLELERLSSAFGIGVMQLCDQSGDLRDNPVVYPAQRRDSLNWATMDKLARLNPDFSDFVVRVQGDFESTTRKVIHERYDRIEDDIVAYIKKKSVSS